MAPNVERILQCISRCDQEAVQTELDSYNTVHAECFFFDVEERERRKQQELDEFRKNKVRDYVPESDSDFNSDSEEEDPDVLLRQRLASALVHYISKRKPLHPGVLTACLRTLRILSRDRQALGSLVTDAALLTLAHHGGLTSDPSLLHEKEEQEDEAGQQEAQADWSTGVDGEVLCYPTNGHQMLAVASNQMLEVVSDPMLAVASNQMLAVSSDQGLAMSRDQTLAVASDQTLVVASDQTLIEPDGAEEEKEGGSGDQACCGTGLPRPPPPIPITPTVTVVVEAPGSPTPGELAPPPIGRRRSPKVRGSPGLARGKKDARADWREAGERGEEEEEGEVCRKEAVKTLCNVIYHSPAAQDRASALRLLPALSQRLASEIEIGVSTTVQFYELRLLFLLTALRPELRTQLQQEGGVAMLTAGLEQCLATRWGRDNTATLGDGGQTPPPVPRESSERAIEILKTLFNVTCCCRRQEPQEEDSANFRRLAEILRQCLLLSCEEEELTEEVQGHTVNVLSSLPLRCLEVLLSAPPRREGENRQGRGEGGQEWEGVNMDSVHALLLFMEKRIERGMKLKEKLTPVLTLLTESCRGHRETRHYLRQQILPPLRDVALRPEQGSTLRGRLVRLMTHVDTGVKHCAAELLFVLCKENVSRFVKYTGYGNAAGLLAARGLLGGRRGGGDADARGPTLYSSDSDSDTEEYRAARSRINPVTGRVEEAQPDPMQGMTEEEKEREAQRLIGLFNRLSRDRIIQPMGVTTEGRLAPLCGQMRGRAGEEDEEEEEEEEEEGHKEYMDQ